ncbi:ABC transporter permease [Methanosarcina mazei]|jgi:lipoprotein-releasing system permease protein|nr:ABC transporter permease [Methanosarcina mazei]AGF95557.1 Lipoprotein releasing system transmembrane protein LolC [Methanosarcina mazei Tuc01]AKB40203.1 Lipoprotein releasing system transmembrane protein LolC [Methanosarcina mazei WWM610]AKB67766.1 Lipoprotein releasing system transmembrane protein LolC [Methanosarcina mazei LYC]AKB72477.1 Lipoprotein releasing system transmembrane protein LolC [Methanosarcina mazei C16]KKF98353.1 ABC transporter substrate-binding protein [Methanosarcina ma
MNYELFIAFRQIRARKFQTLLSVGAIAIAVMVLTVSQALMVGFTGELYKTTVDKLPHVSVSPQEGEDYIYLYGTLMERIGTIEGVTAVSPFLTGQASFRFKDNSLNAELRGVVPSQENEISSIEEDIVEGSFRELEFSRNTVVIGSKLAEKLEVNLGDSIAVSFPNANPLSLRVVGIFHTRSPLDESLTYTSLDTARRFYDVPNVVNGVWVRLSDFNRDREVAEEIEELGYNARGWTEANPAILRTIAIERTSNNVVYGLIIVIASFGVVSTLNLSVIGATGQIGMLRAMGAPVLSIQRIFILQSGILGLLGALVGTFAGVLISLAIGQYEIPSTQADVYAGMSFIPIVVRAQDILIIILAVFLLNLITGIYPARQAAKLDPVKAISTR